MGNFIQSSLYSGIFDFALLPMAVSLGLSFTNFNFTTGGQFIGISNYKNPVSYTHLDVYKRQGYGLLDFIRIFGMNFLDFFDFMTNSVMMPLAALATRCV